MFIADDQSISRIRAALLAGLNWLERGYGRFMETDPLGYEDGLNWYNYVGGDPVNFIDPSGTDAKWEWSCYGNCGPGYANDAHNGQWVGNGEITGTWVTNNDGTRTFTGTATIKWVQYSNATIYIPGLTLAPLLQVPGRFAMPDLSVAGDRLPQNINSQPTKKQSICSSGVSAAAAIGGREMIKNGVASLRGASALELLTEGAAAAAGSEIIITASVAGGGAYAVDRVTGGSISNSVGKLVGCKPK